ncbi:MAG TPA: STAS domain-containing protein [Tepidisphaeraceae bacterium]|jgi:anti-anti-sigma factor|nr:STAS domain-containing protein [Tepidisphaeraceae bacterium]
MQQLECNECGSATVISVKGDLLAAEALAISQVVANGASQPNIVIDFDACRFFASVGLEALLGALRACEERGGRLMLAGLDKNCRKILEITRLEHRFECHPEVASALKVL